jgi:UDP-N-acetylmuramyl pentapeptide phosphotransferase/UDP-N-acetylglucosamine-1-phosphate transferase
MGVVIAMGWLVAALLITLVLVGQAIVYAHRRGMLDQPGQRRSHTLPTPRGGGIGVVIAMLLCMPGALLGMPSSALANAWPMSVVVTISIALVLVALTGWWDDHRPLPALPRFGVQLLAVLVFSVSLLATGLSWWWLPLLLGAGAWSINLHNFMDGIDGLLAQQAVFVGTGVAIIAWSLAQMALATAAGALAASALAFGFYNRPPARIFMGDVGSGSIGLLIFAFGAMLWRLDHALLWPVLILSSAFLVDATLTLLMRMWRGRRWYNAHREHLYQWMVRRGGSHARTDGFYLAWNVLVAAPLAWLACTHLSMAFPLTVLLYLCAAAVWLTLKRRYLRRNLTRDRHVAA